MSALRLSVAASAVMLAASGLPLLGAATAGAAVGPAIPWDFNGDGNADLAVGAPGEDIGSGSSRKVDAGSVAVFMADDVTGAYTSATVWAQGSSTGTGVVPGVAESGDQFGYATTSGDYNGDGWADLAIASNKEDVGSGTSRKRDSGTVTVLWGSASGLSAAGSVSLAFNPGEVIYAGSFYGDALASGDVDGDGFDELAVGAPGRESVRVYTGAATGAFGTAWRTFSEATAGVKGTKHTGDLFGETLAFGDFDGDGRADLAVGAPYDRDDRGFSVGAVVVVPGSSTGLSLATTTRWSPDTAGIYGTGHRFTVNDLPDSFGRTLAVGNFAGDSADDLAIGIPGSPVPNPRGGKALEDAGQVQVLAGKAGVGLTASDVLISQETTGVPGDSRSGDLFGGSLDGGSTAAVLDLLAIGSAEESVRILKGARGLDATWLSQNSSGFPNTTESGDAFGAFVRFLDNAGSGVESLAISAPGEDSSAGAVFVMPTSTVPLGSQAEQLDENSVDVNGTKESGDAWGWLGDSH